MSTPNTDAGIRRVGRRVGRIDGAVDVPPAPPVEVQPSAGRVVAYADGSSVEGEPSEARRILARERAAITVVATEAEENLRAAREVLEQAEKTIGVYDSDHNRARFRAARADADFHEIRFRRVRERLANVDDRIENMSAEQAALDEQLGIAKRPLSLDDETREQLHRAATVIVEAHRMLVAQAERAQGARLAAQDIAARLRIPEGELHIRAPESGDARVTCGRVFVEGLRAAGANPHDVGRWLCRFGL